MCPKRCSCGRNLNINFGGKSKRLVELTCLEWRVSLECLWTDVALVWPHIGMHSQVHVVGVVRAQLLSADL